MAYDFENEIDRVKKYYEGDSLQKRFSALITGETNTGKTYLLRTARLPIHIDSFDPGGTKCLMANSKWSETDPRRFSSLYDRIDNPVGQIFADTQWENEDPLQPKVFPEWKKSCDIRFRIKYFNHFATYCIDSATTFGNTVMNDVLNSKSRAGEVPQHRHDYNPQKVAMSNYISKLMNIPCDFFMTGHLKEIKKLIHMDTKTGVAHEEIKYRFYTTGQAVITIPLLFDEIYVIIGKEQGQGREPKREMLIDSLGTYIARSRLKAAGKLDAVEPPDIKTLLKKAGLSWGDKPFIGKEVNKNE